MEQQGTTVEGTITLEGTACLSDGVVRGTAAGNEVRLSVVQREVQIDYSGTRSGETISGAYTSRCDGGPGTWEAKKTG